MWAEVACSSVGCEALIMDVVVKCSCVVSCECPDTDL